MRDDVLVTFVLKDADRRIHPCTGLKFPEPFASGGIQCGEAPVVASCEHEAARRRHRTAVARVPPALLPHEAVRLHVERCEDAGQRQRRTTERTAKVPLPLRCDLLVLLAAPEDVRGVGCTHVPDVGRWIVGAWRPVRTAAGA